MYSSIVATPIGNLFIEADDEVVSGISFTDHALPEHPNELTGRAAAELQEYFNGDRYSFTFPFRQEGTGFSMQVWKELETISPGKPISYQALSKRMNNPLAIRAIASANGRNNLVIVVPCHRVIGSDGSLVGFSAGLWRKKWLLEHEAKMMNMGQSVLTF